MQENPTMDRTEYSVGIRWVRKFLASQGETQYNEWEIIQIGVLSYGMNRRGTYQITVSRVDSGDCHVGLTPSSQ